MKPIKMLSFAAIAALTAMAFVGASSAMAEATALCDIDPGTGAHEVCPPGHLLTHVHERTLEGKKSKLLTTFLTVECDVLFLGDVISANNLSEVIKNEKGEITGYKPLEILGHLTYTNCGSCTVTETSKHDLMAILKLGHELADVTYELQIHEVCGSSLDCEYKGEGILGHALGLLLTGEGETNGEVRIEGQQVKKVAGGFLCPKITQLDILTTPFLSEAEIKLAEEMNEKFRSGPTYITE